MESKWCSIKIQSEKNKLAPLMEVLDSTLIMDIS